MNLKNNLKLSKTILLSIMLLISFVSSASCRTFEFLCTPNIIKDSNSNEPIHISVIQSESGPLPENFEIKIDFDNDVFKKNSKIDYCEEINKNYKHSKNMFGNEISIKFSLKSSKTAPDINKDQEIFMITMETKKSIPKSETNFKITMENDLENEIKDIPIKVEKSDCEKSSPALTKLIPRQGTLVPEFNPAVNEYSLNVPCDIKDIEFDVDSENSSEININRHKLNAPGSETDIFITVKGEKKGIKNVYHIAVRRDDIQENENIKSKRSSKNSVLKQFMARGKSSENRKQKSQKNKKYDIDENNALEDNNENPDTKIFKEIEINRKESGDKNKGKLYSIIILSSLLCLYVVYMVIKKKKELNKSSKK